MTTRRQTAMRFRSADNAAITKIMEVYNLKTRIEAVQLALFFLAQSPKVDWLGSGKGRQYTQSGETEAQAEDRKA